LYFNPWTFYCMWFYPLEFAYCFGKKRNNKRPEENIGDPRKNSGQTSQTGTMSLLKEPHLFMHLFCAVTVALKDVMEDIFLIS